MGLVIPHYPSRDTTANGVEMSTSKIKTTDMDKYPENFTPVNLVDIPDDRMNEQKAYADKQSVIRVKAQCNQCSGSGRMAVRVGVQDLMTILEAHPDNKIQRVKAVREKWLFGLKTAKDIVEAYDRLLTDLTEIRYS